MLRVTLAPTFVGPRGQDSLDSSETLWFALQTSGGFDTEPADKLAALRLIWPWSLNVLSGDTVDVSVYSIAEDNTVTEVSPALLRPSPIASAQPVFHDKLQQSIKNNYEDASTLESLNFTTYFPSEISGIGTPEQIEERLRKNVPSRLAFLSTLPPGLAEPLLATTYVGIDRDALFVQAGGKWEPKNRYLWLAPSTIKADTGQIGLDGLPAEDPVLEVWTQAYLGDAAAYGALIDLNDIAEPDVISHFNLESYWLPVALGDRRFAMAEGWVVSILDPFSELREFDAEEYRSQLKFHHATTGLETRGITADEIVLLRNLWLVDKLRSRLSRDKVALPYKVLNFALEYLVSQVSAQIDQFNRPPVEELLGKIPDALPASFDSQDLLTSLRDLARILRVHVDNDRALLAAVAAQSRDSTVVEILHRVFTTLLGDLARTSQTQPNEWAALDDAWNADLDTFGGTQTQRAKRIKDRQLAQIHTAFEQAMDAKGRRHLSSLANAASTGGTIKWFRQYLSDQIVERWDARFGDKTIIDTLRTILLAEPSNADPGNVDQLALDIPADNILKFSDGGKLNSIIERYVEPFFEARLTNDPDAFADNGGVSPETGAEPVDLIIGSADSRLIHEDGTGTSGLPLIRGGNGDVFDEFVGHLLLVRRSSGRRTDLGAATWRIPSAGLAALDRMTTHLFGPDTPVDSWLPVLLPIPEENNFEDGVLRMDRSFDGQPRHTQNPLELAYCGEGNAENVSDDENFDQAPFYYQSLGLFKGHAGPPNLDLEAQVSSSPVLRYGDWYEFASALVDNAGGLARELQSNTEPWKFDSNKLETPFNVPESCVIRYRRRRPVGELNVRPTSLGGWIPIPDGVALRATEWWSATHGESDNVATALLFDGGSFSANKPSFEFTISPPSIDEFTLLRWIVSPTDALPAQIEADKIDYKTALENILTARRSTCEANARNAATRLENDDYERAVELGFVHDPAVTAIGVTIDIFRPNGEKESLKLSPKPLDDVDNRDDFPYRKKDLEFKVSYTNDAPIPTVADLEALPVRDINFLLPEGHFCLIEVHPLVTADDFADRFAQMRPESFSVDPTIWTDYVAFPASRVLVESASPALPDAEECYKSLQLACESEAVEIRFDEAQLSDPSLLQMVDHYDVPRDRWEWRNRPILEGAVSPPISDADRRKLVSALPDDAFDELRRDDSEDVRNWETLASLDRGFVSRPQLSGRWPRRPGSLRQAADVVPVTTTLQIDGRDGSMAGAYLRYGIKLRSRYAPILKEEFRSVTANRPIQLTSGLREEDKKRIVAPFPSTAHIAPLKILAVLPLTRSLSSEDDPIIQENRAVPPFLVILDETWFRHYGVGERLEARLTLEPADIGEDLTKEFPYRAGPLPDHHLPPDTPYKQPKTIEEDKTNPVRLEVFGPFGYTLDDVPNEALANATAFVVYPPIDDPLPSPQVDSHWSFFVNFRRVIDYPDFKLGESEPSEVYPLYSLPDERALVEAESDKRALLMLSRRGEDGTYSATPNGLALRMTPTNQNTADDSQSAGSYGTMKHYRHFLLLSEPMRAAGRNATVERPVSLLRFDNSTAAEEFMLWSVGREPTGSVFIGRIMEVMLNGKYEFEAPLDTVTSIKQFWNRVLSPVDYSGHRQNEQATMEDAWGMVRRLSDSFDVELD